MQTKINHSLRLIAESLEKYKKIAVFSSFGKDSIVTIHLAQRVDPNVKIVGIVTPFKFDETIRYRRNIIKSWNLNYEQFGLDKYESYRDPEPMYELEGAEPLYQKDVEECCEVYKVEPTKEAIKTLELDAWICGLRGTEGHTREFLNEVEERQGLIKINPILKWTEAEIWLYHAANNIPVHFLYTQGYRSLGCEPCSKSYSETERGGRWVGSNKCSGECGIHSKPLKD